MKTSIADNCNYQLIRNYSFLETQTKNLEIQNEAIFAKSTA
jgi:hypothetical protein